MKSPGGGFSGGAGGGAKRRGYADLPLHTGTVPSWLSDRMRDLGGLIIEELLIQGGKDEVLRRLSDPLWFQSFGAVLGMDWHSSGITTSVMYALKRAINPRAREFGLCVCGGRGRYSRKTPDEILYLSDATGLPGDDLVRASRLTAKVDSAAVQDGFQLYSHNFILSDRGDWVVVQQGMNTASRTARRYHWSSGNLKSFTDEPHSGVTGENRGLILNLTAHEADATRSAVLSLSREEPDRVLRETRLIAAAARSRGQDAFERESPARKEEPHQVRPGGAERSITMPRSHSVLEKDVDLKRLGAVLALAYESNPADFDSLLLTRGLGARTLQALTLVSEVINGTPSRFTDPARFSFAHGGKDGHPFPVPLRVYDESIRTLHDAIEKSRMGYRDKSDCIRRLHQSALAIEENCSPEADFDAVLRHEKEHSAEWGGRSVYGVSK